MSSQATSEAHVLAAVTLLGATEYEGGASYAYTPAEMPGHVYLVQRGDMADLGLRLESDRGAYSLWCAETPSESTTLTEACRDCAGVAWEAAGLRDAAASAGDILTVAAIDLLDH